MQDRTNCKDCKYPDLCSAFSTIEDHLAPDGQHREIIGCDVNVYFFGDILTQGKINEIATFGRRMR